MHYVRSKNQSWLEKLFDWGLLAHNLKLIYANRLYFNSSSITCSRVELKSLGYFHQFAYPALRYDTSHKTNSELQDELQ